MVMDEPAHRLGIISTSEGAGWRPGQRPGQGPGFRRRIIRWSALCMLASHCLVPGDLSKPAS